MYLLCMCVGYNFKCLLFQQTVVLTFFLRFKNRPHMTFDDVNSAAEQEFDLQQDPTGTLEYTTK